MAKIVSGFARAATQGVTNPLTPPSDAVALTDGEGNIIGTGAAPLTAVTPGSQVAFPVYTESAVVNGARLTSGNIAGGSVPNNAAALLVSVSVSVFTGGTNLVYSLQVQDANGNWVTVGSTATITATGVYGFSVGAGMGNGNVLPSGNGNWRVSWVATGTFTAVTSQIGVTGR